MANRELSQTVNLNRGVGKAGQRKDFFSLRVGSLRVVGMLYTTQVFYDNRQRRQRLEKRGKIITCKAINASRATNYQPQLVGPAPDRQRIISRRTGIGG